MPSLPPPHHHHSNRRLILASTSVYRRELLNRLGLAFSVIASNVQEFCQPDESPQHMACRLALAKAQFVALQHPDAVIIGSDQVADLDGQSLGKPGTHDRAVTQLQAMRGKTVVFQTAVAVVCVEIGFIQTELAQVRVKFRDLSDTQIEAYLQAEKPYDCAGSAKSEGLGIALLERIDNDDPTALIGLPLIRTRQLIEAAGIIVL
jgi:septum formation protein